MQQAKSSTSHHRHMASCPVEEGGQARNIQTPQSTSSMGTHPRRVVTPRLRHAPIRRPPRSASQCAASSSPTTSRAMSSTRGN
jgi:hypothetical protein